MPPDGERPIALDTSVAVPLIVQTHKAHRRVVQWWRQRPAALSGHALIETYSVLTRLPGDIRLDAADAARLLSEQFAPPLSIPVAQMQRMPVRLASMDIAGGATYDAIVALAAVVHGCVLATRDGRALATYQSVGAQVELIA